MTMKVGDVTLTNKIICTDEGLQMGRFPTISPGELGGLNAQIESETVEGVYILPEKQLTPGARWTARYVLKGNVDSSGQQMDMTNDLILSFEVVGVESVTVPGGTFEALKVKQQITSKATMQGASTDLPAMTFDQFVWFVKDVGMVKASGTIANVGEVVTEMMHYSLP